jgi:hypothetical protein
MLHLNVAGNVPSEMYEEEVLIFLAFIFIASCYLHSLLSIADTTTHHRLLINLLLCSVEV